MNQTAKQSIEVTVNKVRVPVLESTKNAISKELAKNKRYKSYYQSFGISNGAMSLIMFIMVYVGNKTIDPSLLLYSLQAGLTAGGIAAAICSAISVIEAEGYRKLSKNNKRDLDAIQSKIARLKDEISAYNTTKQKILTR